MFSAAAGYRVMTRYCVIVLLVVTPNCPELTPPMPDLCGRGDVEIMVMIGWLGR